MSKKDPLPSWVECNAKSSIIEFVRRVTNEKSGEFVPVNERIAVFDNDGTLWCEMPAPVQALFAGDRLRKLVPEHPEWLTTEPFKSILDRDLKGLMAQGIKGVAEIAMATHAGMTTDEFADIVRDWLATAVHPHLQRPYTRVVYQPMIELLKYLRANNFATFIVSGGGVEFMRVFAEKVYGIPPHQVIGSTIKTHFDIQDGKPVLRRDPAVDFFDDKAGKPVSINRHIGQRPILCFGNSDGDREMLIWTTCNNKHPSLGLIVHHTDGEREFAYDRQPVLSGQLNTALDEAGNYGWVLTDMQRDWKVVFPVTVKTAVVT